MERRHIAAVLRRCAGRVEQAAEILDVSRSAPYAKLENYGLTEQGQ